MDEIISQCVKVLSNTIMFHLYSYPHYSIEIFMAAAVCVVHYLLLVEVNSLYRRTNARAAAKLRMRHPLKDNESFSYHTLSRYQTEIFPQRIETTTTKQSYYVPYKRMSRKISTNSNFGWVISRGDSELPHSFNDRVQHLLSISPSEYVRKDKERKSREAGLRSCIQSLTSLLEKALDNDSLKLENMSKDAIKQSINAIRENFETHLSRDNYQLTEYGNYSLQSLISQSMTKRTLRNSLAPPLLNSDSSVYNIDKYNELENTDHKKGEETKTNFCRKQSLDNLMSDLFNDDSSSEVIHNDQNPQLPAILQDD